MSTSSVLSQIVVIVDKSLDAAKQLGILASGFGLESMDRIGGRSQMLENHTGIFAALKGGAELVSSPVEKFILTAPLSVEEVLMTAIIESLQLHHVGRGTVYSEQVIVYGNNVHSAPAAAIAQTSRHLCTRLQTELMGICCIVQRGKGDVIARLALDTGTCVPATTFGIGTGLRDKLGLLRITIPAEKEVINVIASNYDAEAVMDMMIDVGRLDQPGRGFIYIYPVIKGMINTKVSRGMPNHAASVEQIIAAVDEIKGGAEWRSRGETGESGTRAKRAYLSNLVDLTMVCDEGCGADLVTAAMAVGAAGATITKASHLSFVKESSDAVSPAREMCSMVINEKQVDLVVDALVKAGVFRKETHGTIYSRLVPKACTYLARK